MIITYTALEIAAAALHDPAIWAQAIRCEATPKGPNDVSRPMDAALLNMLAAQAKSTLATGTMASQYAAELLRQAARHEIAECQHQGYGREDVKAVLASL